MSPHVPQELVDLVVDESKDDASALATLGLVSKAWYPRTRVYLFRKAIIGGNNPSHKLKVLLSLLKKNRHLPPCIRHLALGNSGSRNWLGKTPATSKRVAELLPVLASLQHLSLYGGVSRWKAMHPIFQEAVVTALGRQNITRFTLETILLDLDAAHFSNFRHLKSLELVCVRNDRLPKSLPWTVPLRPLPPLPSKTERLQILHLSCCASAYYTLVSSSVESGAANLLYPLELSIKTFMWSDEMKAAWELFLTVGAPNLERYTVVQNDSFFSISGDPFPSCLFDFGSFLKLKKFTLVVRQKSMQYPGHNPIPPFLEALTSLSNSATQIKLRKIALEINFLSDPYGGVVARQDLSIWQALRELSRDRFWAELDEVLDRPAFTFLDEVKIVFHGTPQLEEISTDFDARARTDIANAMSNLDAGKGILKIETIPRPRA